MKPPPATWRLGSRPNLKQMHAAAVQSVADTVVEARLLDDIRKARALTATATQAGAKVHMLPDRPVLVDDDGEFRYVVLGPPAASESGRPSAFARRFLDETTGPDRPRTNRNAIVIAAPSKDGVEAARQAVRDHQGWLAVTDALQKDGQQIEYTRQQALDTYTSTALARVTDTIVQAYSIVVTVSAENQVQAFKVQVTGTPLFGVIKGDTRTRIQETAVSPDAMLPGGPYDLWRENEDARWVKDLVGAFAQKASLPKMLSRQAIVDTVVRGCADGYFVARLRRPDGSVRSWWRQPIDEAVLEEPLLEVVLPEKAELTAVPPRLLRPRTIGDLWSTDVITVGSVRAFFDGSRAMTVSRGGYDEPIPVPRAPASVVDQAIGDAVRGGDLWLTLGPASVLSEEIPPGLLSEVAELQAPPAAIASIALMPDALPAAWKDGRTSALGLAAALSQKVGRNLPWPVVRTAIDGALRARLLERVDGGPPWPADYASAGAVTIQLLSGKGTDGVDGGPSQPAVPDDTRVSPEVVLQANELQDLADVVPDLLRAAAGQALTFSIRITVKGGTRPADDVVTAVNDALKDVAGGIRVE
jgi:hypothetical protein